MRLSQLVIRNAARTPFRTCMTVATLAVMLTAFIFPRTLVEAQQEQVRQAANDRIVIQPKVGGPGALPARYADEIRAIEGIKHAEGCRWAGFKVPGKEDVFFESYGVDAEPLLMMHREIVAPQAAKQAFIDDERSALVSADVARLFGWKVGDRLVFESRELPGKWEVSIACIYEAVAADWAKHTVWIHYGYFNRVLPTAERDSLSFVSAQIFDPTRAGALAKAIDRGFDARPVRTLTLEDRVLSAATVGRFRAILTAMDLVSYMILAVVVSILANTLAMNVRERAREFGVLRAIGFGPAHLVALVLGEAALLGFAGTSLGLALSYPLLEGLLGPFLEEAFRFPPVTIPLRVIVTASAAGTVVVMLAAVLPARNLMRVEVKDALGRVT